MKTCARCGEEKPLSEFHKNKKAKDGLQSFCKECRNKAERESYRKKEKRDRSEYLKEYYEKNKEKIKARQRANWPERYAREKEQVLERSKAWVKDNRERVNERNRRWRKNNPSSVKLSKSKRRALKKDTQVEKITPELLAEHWAERNIDQDRCFYCEEGTYEHLDHYIPLSKGGGHTKENLVPSCASCNLKKHDKMPEDFIKEQKEIK